MTANPLVFFLPVAVGQEKLTPYIRYVPARKSVDIQKSLGFTGSAIPDKTTNDDSRSPAAIYIIAGSVALNTLSETVLKFYKNWKYGGMILS